MQIYSKKEFINPVETVAVFTPEKIRQGLDRIEELRNLGLYLVGYMRYDLGRADEKGLPLIFFEAYAGYRDIDLSATPEYDGSESGMPVGTVIKPLITRENYYRSIAFIKEQIAAGNTYEVNYTYPSRVETGATDMELYRHFLTRQETPYNAFIKNSYETILSFSPELFFQVKGNSITTRPMKGTIRRGATPEEDEANRLFLSSDPKNRAENIMIVDLLRNDLSVIAKDGTVKVDRLFAVEEHPTLFQMTSEISAKMREDVSLYDIVKAIYPCGSITGAPKLSTMRVISEVEVADRGVYCGAIGYLHGDEMIFSVPIRILQRRADESFYTYWAGGAVTYDSTAEGEWQETLTKTKFLQTDYSLIETGTGDSGMHILRLKNSAAMLGFTWNPELDSFVFPEGIVTRIELSRDGRYDVTTRNIPAPAVRPKVCLKGKVNSANPFLYHKTTIRSPFAKDTFEEIRVNERGEITEGTYTNVAAEIDGVIYTPPVSCGLLNGVMRRKLLDARKIREKVLYPKDLRTADRVFCMNSVRGMFEVELTEDA